jgi:hypothetical protein
MVEFRMPPPTCDTISSPPNENSREMIRTDWHSRVIIAGRMVTLVRTRLANKREGDAYHEYGPTRWVTQRC